MTSQAVHAVVYQARNLVNGHRYIGFTTKGLPVREGQHRKDARCKRGGFRFHTAIRKYGGENFVFEMLADFADDEDLAKVFEWEAIAKWKPEYNLSAGGDGGTMAQETRDKISAATMGRVGTHLGKKFSDETRRRMSAAMKGKPHPAAQGVPRSAEVRRQLSLSQMGHAPTRIGPLSEETKRKLSIANKGQVPWSKGKKFSDEHRRKISVAHMGKPKPRRKKLG